MAYRIYIVDDDRFLLDLYAVKFKNGGHDVSVFNEGGAFLDELRKEGAPMPNAILLDIIMPNMTGLEVLETIRKEGLAKGAKVVFLTNQGQNPDIDRAKELKADGYIVKASAIPSEVFSEVIRIIEESPAS